MSIASLLSIARSALLAQQRAMEIAGHNVANAQTPGYSRQRAQLEAATPLATPQGAIGRGVTLAGVERMRDAFLDAAFRGQSALLGHSSTRSDVLGGVVGALNEPSDSGVGSALDGLFSAFSDLATDPTAAGARTLAKSAAQRVVDALHGLDRQLKQSASDVTDRLRAQVSEVNDLARSIADLNAQILASGNNAPDLEDRRDGAIDQLAARMNVRVETRSDGTLSVLAGDATLVDGARAHALELRPAAGGGLEIGFASGRAVDPQGGSVGALLELANTTLPGIQSQLDAIAGAVVTEVNALHRTGTNALGQTGVDLFDPAGVTAGSIALSAAVQASPDAIAAGTGASGDGSVALAISHLAHTGVASLGGVSLRDAFTNLATSLGVDARNASQDQDTDQALVDQADARRTAVSGVSVDEEMTLLISQQQAYGAAARLVQTAQQMMDELMTSLGTPTA